MLHSKPKNGSVMQHSYERLIAPLREAIREGQWPPGQRLPAVRALAQAQGVSVSTVMRGYRQLEREGWVQARDRAGLFVADWAAAQATTSPARALPQAVAYDRLASVAHRTTELYALTRQPLQWGLHLATAVDSWYACDTWAQLGQKLLRQSPGLLGTYATGAGDPELTEALSHWMRRTGLDLAPQDWLITQGSTEALSVALRATTRPGDAVIVESPAYFGLLQMLDNLGLRTVEVPSRVPGGLSLDALEFALEHRRDVRAVVVMPSFHNPLGVAMSPLHKRRLLRLVEHHGLALIEDDAFGELGEGPERPTPIKAWDRQGRVIYCGSCTKSLAPGLRVGWTHGGRWHADMVSLKLSQSLATPVYEQRLLAAFLAGGHALPHLRRLRERLHAAVEPATQVVRAHFPPGTEIISRASGWWLWLALPGAVDTMALLRHTVAQGLSFTPGGLFSTGDKFDHCLRINIARPWDATLQAGLERLGQAATQACRGR